MKFAWDWETRAVLWRRCTACAGTVTSQRSHKIWSRRGRWPPCILAAMPLDAIGPWRNLKISPTLRAGWAGVARAASGGAWESCELRGFGATHRRGAAILPDLGIPYHSSQLCPNTSQLSPHFQILLGHRVAAQPQDTSVQPKNWVLAS